MKITLTPVVSSSLRYKELLQGIGSGLKKYFCNINKKFIPPN